MSSGATVTTAASTRSCTRTTISRSRAARFTFHPRKVEIAIAARGRAMLSTAFAAIHATANDASDAICTKCSEPPEEPARKLTETWYDARR